jgi:AraC-like DNA-binding protein
MLGIRFHPHTAPMILEDRIAVFNDGVFDFEAIAGSEAQILHEQLLNCLAINHQLNLLESFLLKKLNAFQKRKTKFEVVNRVIAEMKNEDFCDDIQNVAFRYGISSRYLQKLFVEFTGLSPKLYSKINRFQKSLALTSNNDQSLTSIAYQSGYFDQSHFIRDFKLFTGVSPSSFDGKDSSAILVSQNR